MRRLIAYCFCNFFLLLIGSGVFAQKPFNQDPDNPNLDFSLGNLNHWKLSWGNRGLPFTNDGVMTGGSSHTLIELYGTNWDGNAGTGNLKRVPDGLQQTARLGAPGGGGYSDPKSYAMQYDVAVNAAYPILFFQLASIMDITHDDEQNTNYKFSIKNESGNYLLAQPCAGLQLTARGRSATPAGNVYSNPAIDFHFLPEIGSVLYQPWQSVAIDLSAYAGQTVTFVLEHSDCYTGYHGSYTYLSAAMRSATDTFYFCSGAASTTIRPYQPNFKSYLWDDGSTADSLVINTPIDGAIYNCSVSSYNGCNTSFTYVLKEVKVEADFSHAGGGICNQILFFDRSITNVGNIARWSWVFGDAGSGAANFDTTQNPQHTFPGPGAYTVQLTVTDTFGCEATTSKVISVSPEGTIALIQQLTPICLYDTVSFENITTNSSRRTWLLDGTELRDTNRILELQFDHIGNHELMLVAIGSNGCPDTTTKVMEVRALPDATITAYPQTNAAPISDPDFIFKGGAEGAARYVWDFGYVDAYAEGRYPKFTYPAVLADYKVLLKTYDTIGCYDTTTTTVKITTPDFMMPTAFSPNGDGLNDVFYIVNLSNHILKEFSIFNRFGQRLFYTVHPEKGWDGSYYEGQCDIGVYYYNIRYAIPGSDKEFMMKGDVTLVR